MAYSDLKRDKKNHKNKSLIDDDVSTSYESESMCFSRVNSNETSYTHFSNDYIENNEFIKCKSDESKKKIIHDHDNKCDMYSLLSGLPCSPKYRFSFCPWNLKKMTIINLL